MAVYQFVIELLPEAWTKINQYNVELFYNDNMYDVSDAWKNQFFTKELDEKISSILPKAKSWSPELFIWVYEEKNDIQLYINEHKEIESIKIRIDLREKTHPYCNDIISLARYLNCVLFIPEHKKIIDADQRLLSEYLNTSCARKFVECPVDYIDSLTKTDNSENES